MTDLQTNNLRALISEFRENESIESVVTLLTIGSPPIEALPEIADDPSRSESGLFERSGLACLVSFYELVELGCVCACLPDPLPATFQDESRPLLESLDSLRLPLVTSLGMRVRGQPVVERTAPLLAGAYWTLVELHRVVSADHELLSLTHYLTERLNGVDEENSLLVISRPGRYIEAFFGNSAPSEETLPVCGIPRLVALYQELFRLTERSRNDSPWFASGAVHVFSLWTETLTNSVDRLFRAWGEGLLAWQSELRISDQEFRQTRRAVAGVLRRVQEVHSLAAESPWRTLVDTLAAARAAEVESYRIVVRAFEVAARGDLGVASELLSSVRASLSERDAAVAAAIELAHRGDWDGTEERLASVQRAQAELATTRDVPRAVLERAINALEREVVFGRVVLDEPRVFRTAVVTLTWEANGDLDIWLSVRSAGLHTHVSYRRMGSLERWPFARLRDDVRSPGLPEQVDIRFQAAAKYRVYVNAYSGGDLASSGAVLTVKIDDETVGARSCPTGGDERWWLVCEIDPDLGEVEWLDRVQREGPELEELGLS